MQNKFKKLTKIFLILIAICIAQCIFIFSYGFFSLCSSESKSDLIVILGNKVYPDRSLSPVLKSRLDKGIEAYKNNCSSKILVSGGLGKEGHPEGDVMGEYLLKNDIKKEDVFIDNEGINSYFTAINTKKILEENNLNSVLVVSSYYHVFRSKMIMNLIGIENVSVSGTKYIAFQDILKIPRDLAGVYVYLFRYGLGDNFFKKHYISPSISIQKLSIAFFAII